MTPARCQVCGKYLDGLTNGADPHPIYTMCCIECGRRAIAEDGGWTLQDQLRREGLLPEND